MNQTQQQNRNERVLIMNRKTQPVKDESYEKPAVFDIDPVSIVEGGRGDPDKESTPDGPGLGDL